MATTVNKAVVETVQNILGLHASPATVASSLASASNGETAAATITALQSLEACASAIGKSEKWAGPGLAAAALVADAIPCSISKGRFAAVSGAGVPLIPLSEFQAPAQATLIGGLVAARTG